MINGYYSEFLQSLHGRLRVTATSITAELTLKNDSGKKALVSIPLTVSTSSELNARWAAEGKGMHLFGEYHLIESEEELQRIISELSEAYIRGAKIQKALLSIDEPSEITESPEDEVLHEEQHKESLGEIHIEEPAAEKRVKRPRIVLDKKSESVPEPIIVHEPEEDLPPLPNMDNFDKLGSAKHLEFIRHLSFHPSDTDVLRAKATLLIAVMNAIAAGDIDDAKFVPDSKLRKRYLSNWKDNVDRTPVKNFENTVNQMNDEPFWRLEPMSSISQTKSVVPNVSMVQLDQDLYHGMQDKVERNKLRTILMARCK